VDFIAIVGIGVSAFIVTNIDDIFVLMIFFSHPKYHSYNVIFGQYLGIAILVFVSALGSLLALVVPSYVVGLLGVIPIAIGVMKIIQLKEEKNSQGQEQEVQVNKLSYLSFLSVAGITISNGGDNIGVYTPLFAKYHSPPEVTLLILVFMLMTAFWCAIGYYLVKHPLIAVPIRKNAHIILPFVLIGLGIYIIISSL
jgi:cadmium resistance protein CadD (predicted permease)